MKKIILGAAASLLMLGSLNVFADVVKVNISGEPVTVMKSGDVYTFSGTTTYTTTSDYYYISVDGKRQVCYREVQSTFAGISPVDLSLKIGSDTVAVHCYDYSPEYFNVVQ